MRSQFISWVTILCAVGILTSCAGKKKPPLVEPEKEVSVEEPDIRVGEWNSISQVNTVYFDYNKSTLRSDTKATLKEDAEFFKENTDLEVLIEGHCDERGTFEYNLSLGQRRASAVRNYLSKLGIALGTMSTISYGEENPVDYGHNESAWAKNRRAELKVRSTEEDTITEE